MTVSNIAALTKSAGDLATTITDAAGGLAKIRIPTDLYQDAIALDSNDNVPLALVVVTITTGSTPADIHKFRHLIVIRGLPQ